MWTHFKTRRKIRKLNRRRDQLHRYILEAHYLKAQCHYPMSMIREIIKDYHTEIKEINRTIDILNMNAGDAPIAYHILYSKDVL